MRSERIAIYSLQETHLSETQCEDLNDFHRHLVIFNSPLPTNPTGAGGVAVALNKHLLKTDTASMHVLVPGRAIVVNLEWHTSASLTVLAVYAPNDARENRDLWSSIESKIRRRNGAYPKPEVLLGDLNFVEDEIDRFPAHLTPVDAPASFSSLKRYLQVKDGWRTAAPAGQAWSWSNSAASSMSRIDRIYLSQQLEATSRAWSIAPSGIPESDHLRVSAELLDRKAPETGPGRWSMTSAILRDDEFLSTVNDLGTAALEAARELLTSPRTSERNAQTIWKTFKDEVIAAARKRTKILSGKRVSYLKKLNKNKADAASRLASAGSEDAVAAASKDLATANAALRDLKEREMQAVFAKRAAWARVEGETMSKRWFRWAAEPKPRETIASLMVPASAPAKYITHSKSMAQLARAYHNDVQAKDLDVDPAERAARVTEALDHITPRVTPAEADTLGAETSRDETAAQIAASPPGKAAGVDGVIYELWKTLLRRHKARPSGEGACFDIAQLMSLAFRDIDEHGVADGTDFSDGWLCPLYKKGDRSDIANYRPITLLNSDYKLYTGIKALRLARIAPGLIHHSQAGFVRGRSITDQTKVASLMTSYAEAVETDGAIIALDQEKAYDRVRHDYLLAVLERFGVPPAFRRVVESLYRTARTRVMVNGFLSDAFAVTRGVRQGDPLSCLLFNLAIEPLSAMLRRSDLRGFRIPGTMEKLIASLYADDTTVYLSAEDSYEVLSGILQRWCLASGARFNIAKTEVIPLGRPAYRAQLIETRRLAPDGTAIPDGIRIARDGEATRILGAWPGNKTDGAQVWSTVLEKTQRHLDRWERSHPSLFGRSILAQVFIGGCTQYLTAAQGMPDRVEESLEKMTSDFFWGKSRRHTVNKETLRLPRHLGGVNLFHPAGRNEAQYMVWVRLYLEAPEKRPLWAFLADGIFRAHIIQDDAKRVPAEQRLNPLYQAWRPNVRRLPLILQKLLSAARRANVVLDAAELPMRIRETEPIWAHPALNNYDALERNSGPTKCLRSVHEVCTVEDLEEIAEEDELDHEDDPKCICENCITDRSHGCRYPHACAEMARDVLAEVSERWSTSSASQITACPLPTLSPEALREALSQGLPIPFASRLADSESRHDLFRAFGHGLALVSRTAAQATRAPRGKRSTLPASNDPVTVAVASAIDGGRSAHARGAYGAVFSDCGIPDLAFRCNGDEHSHTRNTAMAVCHAAGLAPPNRPLCIVAADRKTIQALTVDLATNENSGWTAFPGESTEFRAASAVLRGRQAATTLSLARGQESRRPDLKAAKEIAERALHGDVAQIVNRRRLAAFDRPGVKVLSLTQRLAHRAANVIRAYETPPREATRRNLQEVQTVLSRDYDLHPSERQIWASLQNKALSRNVRDFLWKGLHEGHKVGPYFAKMKQPWLAKATCTSCGVQESMEHVLTSCTSSGQSVIWALARDKLEPHGVDLRVNLGTIWGCGLLPVRLEGGKRDPASERAMTIVISESAFLVWKIRCEARIEHADDRDWQLSDAAITERWQNAMARREEQDRLLTKREIFGKKALDATLVGSTWDPSLAHIRALQPYLLKYIPGVLVGRGSAAQALGIG